MLVGFLIKVTIIFKFLSKVSGTGVDVAFIWGCVCGLFAIYSITMMQISAVWKHYTELKWNVLAKLILEKLTF